MKKYCLAGFSLLFLLSSCTTFRYIFTASPANNPYFTKKGQSKVAAYFSTDGGEAKKDITNGFDIQGAYAFSDRWAVIGGYYHRNERQISEDGYQLRDSSMVKYKRQMFNIGTGYIIPLNKKRITTFNIYGGFAIGEFSFTDQNTRRGYHRFHRSGISQYYVQSSFNFMPNENVHLGFLVKPSFVHYGNVRTDYFREELEKFGLDVINNKTFSFVELGFNVQLGLSKYPWVKLDGIISTSSIPYVFPQGLEVHSGNLSIGLCFDLSKTKSRERHKKAGKDISKK